MSSVSRIRGISDKQKERLLVISDGKLKRADVGITVFRNPMDQVVRLPASIHKVTISAQQVSKEMQGVEVSGFIVWTVNRVGDGPLKCYKYLQGLSEKGLNDAASQIKGMAESIIRHQVANLQLNEVIANREILREKVRADMHSVVQGWGIWLETVEVTDVRVLSQSVFDDLQTEFRQALRAKAEMTRVNTTRDLQLNRMKADAEVEELRAESERQQKARELWDGLALAQERAKVELEEHTLALKKLVQEHELKLRNAQLESELATKMLEDELRIAKLRSDSELVIAKAVQELEAKMSPASLKKLELEATKEIYRNLPLRDVKLFHTSEAGSLQSLIPTLSEIHKQVSGD